MRSVPLRNERLRGAQPSMGGLLHGSATLAWDIKQIFKYLTKLRRPLLPNRTNTFLKLRTRIVYALTARLVI